jgi:hypothetical protein
LPQSSSSFAWQVVTFLDISILAPTHFLHLAAAHPANNKSFKIKRKSAKMIEFDPHHFLNVKLGVHVTQAVFIFVAWAIEIAVFKSSATVDGRAGWYFGLVGFPSLLRQSLPPWPHFLYSLLWQNHPR